MPTKSRYTADERDHALTVLREHLAPGSTVYTVLRHVSRSGTQRSISLLAVVDGRIEDLSYFAARAMGDRIDRDRGGIVVHGAGMDMGFHLVYNLSRTLFPDGFAPIAPDNRSPLAVIGIRPSDGQSVNVNIGRGRNAGPVTRPEIAELVAAGWTFPYGRNGDVSGWNNDGGYALRHRWV